jgi:hypothetical protein
MIGQARMDRYLADCGGDVQLAQQLIAWNISMSAAMHQSLHVFEVLLRNAMNEQLQVWNDAQGYSRTWLLTPDPRLRKLLNPHTLKTALSRSAGVAQDAGRQRTHDDVLAQMTMGTWRFLLPSNSSEAKQRLWDAALVQAFPGWSGTWDTLVRKVETVYTLRNRVAHLEPIHRTNLRAARKDMRGITQAIDVDTGRVFKRFDEGSLPLIDAHPLRPGPLS